MNAQIGFELPERLRLRNGASSSALIASASAAVLLLIYWETAASMIGIWRRSDTFAHGFVVVPIVAWLMWRNREAFASVPARPFWPGLALVGAGGALWLVSALAGVTVGEHLALVIVLQATIIAVLGLQLARAIAFPIAFLLFAVPAGEFLVPQLIDWTADFTVAALHATGVPVYREGNHFMVPSGSWSVVEACSGLRYLIASIMVGTLYAYLTYRSTLRRLIFIGAAAVIPIFANWVRAYLIVMLGHLSGNQLAAGVDHLVYGWAFFGIVVLLMFWAGSFWREDPRPSQPPLTARPDRTKPLQKSVLPLAIAVLIVGAVWQPIRLGIERGMEDRMPVLARVDDSAEWTAVPGTVDWKPHYAGHRAELRQAFRKNGSSVEVYLAYYARQEQNRELVNSQNVLAPAGDQRWKQVASGSAPLIWAGKPLIARSAEVVGAETRLSVVHCYWIGGYVTASDHVAKLLLAWSKLVGRDDDSALVAIFSATPDGGQSADVLHRFVAEMSPSIDRALTRTRDRN
jgi:exosortase A